MLALEVASLTDVGSRQTNEDSLLAERIGSVHVLAIADGLGGHAAGEVASSLALQQVQRYFEENPHIGHPQKALREAVVRANEEIRLLSGRNHEYDRMGTTLVVALFVQEKIFLANVGDSRAYYMKGYSISQITKDHSLVQELIDQQVLSPEEAFAYPRKNIITQALGLRDEVQMDFYDVDSLSGVLLLCSDGLSDVLRDREMADTVASSETLDEACHRLVSLAKEKGSLDNISVILVRRASAVETNLVC